MRKIIVTLCLTFTLTIMLTGCTNQQNTQSSDGSTENDIVKQVDQSKDSNNSCYDDCKDTSILAGRTEEQCKKTCDLMKKMAETGCKKASEEMGQGESLATACERYIETYQW